MDARVCLRCQQLQRRVTALEARVVALQQQLDEQHRAGKRQAAPFAKGPPQPEPKSPAKTTAPRPIARRPNNR